MVKPIWKYKRAWLILLLSGLFLLSLQSRGVRIILQTAPNAPRDIAVHAPISTPATIEEWEKEKVDIRSDLEREVYGAFPKDVTLSETFKARLDGTFGNGLANIDILQFDLINKANDKTRKFDVTLITPTGLQTPKGIILQQNFCPIADVVPINGIPAPDPNGFSCSGGGIMGNVMHFFFGRYIVSPPYEDILGQGYAIALMHPPQFIPDRSGQGQAVLDSFFSNYTDNERPGALISWAMQSVLVSDYLGDQFGPVIVAGHSRYGKTALLAAAYSDKIDAVISHQSGTAGASLFVDKPGETLADVVNGYPHWLGANAVNFADNERSLSRDQQHLLALIAPRPVLLGNARRDVWSDPEGAFRAARAASPIYKLYGNQGLGAKSLKDFNPGDDISFWIRRGTHGVIEEDWPAFLEFLNANFE